jgi:Bacterial Ig-like domain/Bacterial TSP3 repeat
LKNWPDKSVYRQLKELVFEQVLYNQAMPAKKVLSASAPVKKPSLASLMPDKGANIRARKKAVKKIETNVSRKETTKNSAIVLTKKSDAASLGVKRAVKKKNTVSKQDSELILPSNMSIRAREKALVLLDRIAKDFNGSAQQIAYVSGLCFMLLGASMALAFSAPFSSPSQSALVASSSIEDGAVQNLTTTPLANPTPPEVSLLDPLPPEVLGMTEHKLAVLHAKNVFVKARSLSDGSVLTLPIDDLSSELYKFVLDSTKFTGGRYVLRALVESAADGSKHDFVLGEFFVPFKQTTQSTVPTATTTTTTTATQTTTLSNATPTTATTTTTTKATSTQSISPAILGPVLTVFAPGSTLQGNVLIKVAAPRDVPFIELYVRAPKSTNSRFVGLAESRSDFWYFFFNTVNVPNGDYELVARTRVSGKEYLSSGVKIKISNFVPQPTSAPIPVITQATTEADEEAQEPITIEEPTGRSLPDFTLSNIDESSESTTQMVKAPIEIQDILSAYTEDIRVLFNRYAVAQQSGDALLVELAKNELVTGKQEILSDILSNESINYLADEIEQVLNERFAILEKRVNTFEELRKTASNGETAIDTDGDGISDFDEQNLYSTDPKLPDTDNDGVLDGVEIMKGFDPKNASTEAVIRYELPQESLSLVQAETLKVESVLPVIINDSESGKLVQAEIVGKALPLSYVTLYIFSTPTVVTVRADENGAFSYTFEKELEDGSHEVYVAITDNTGAIVARSNPFSFVKQAEAFTPLDANASTIASSDTLRSFSPTNTYNVVVGLGILAFGLILLMLGVSMREKTGLVPQDPLHDFKTS